MIFKCEFSELFTGEGSGFMIVESQFTMAGSRPEIIKFAEPTMVKKRTYRSEDIDENTKFSTEYVKYIRRVRKEKGRVHKSVKDYFKGMD
jgi:hypothetical protein